MDLLERLLTPPWVFVVVIANALYWYWLRPRRRAAGEKRAKFLARFLKEALEPELFEALKGLSGGFALYLGVTPGPATTLYQAFELLGGVKALSPEKARWWEKTLRHLAGKFGLEVGPIGGYRQCKHPIRFGHPPQRETLEAYWEKEK